MQSVANEPRSASVPPARIVPMLTDEGVYIASESRFARVLRSEGQNAHRGRAKAHKAVRSPTTHITSSSRQVWCWDMTFLPAIVTGLWLHLYLVLDLYSCKVAGWEVHDSDHSDHAAHLVRRTALPEGIAALTVKPVLHGDNGSALKAAAVLWMLHWLGVKPSYSRPRASDGNAYAESLFRTAKTPLKCLVLRSETGLVAFKSAAALESLLARANEQPDLQAAHKLQRVKAALFGMFNKPGRKNQTSSQTRAVKTGGSNCGKKIHAPGGASGDLAGADREINQAQKPVTLDFQL